MECLAENWFDIVHLISMPDWGRIDGDNRLEISFTNSNDDDDDLKESCLGGGYL